MAGVLEQLGFADFHIHVNHRELLRAFVLAAGLTAEQEAPAATRSVARAPEAAKAKKKTRASPESVTPNLYDVLQSTAEPLLHECTADQANVQTPIECSQEWQAVKGGGFVRTA